MDKVFNRKKELIIRDPTYQEALKTFKQIAGTGEYLAFQDIPSMCEYVRMSGCPEDETLHERKYPDAWKLFKLLGGVECKWHVDLKLETSSKEISVVAPYTNDEVIWIGAPPLISFMTSEELGLGTWLEPVCLREWQ